MTARCKVSFRAFSPLRALERQQRGLTETLDCACESNRASKRAGKRVQQATKVSNAPAHTTARAAHHTAQRAPRGTQAAHRRDLQTTAF